MRGLGCVALPACLACRQGQGPRTPCTHTRGGHAHLRGRVLPQPAQLAHEHPDVEGRAGALARPGECTAVAAWAWGWAALQRMSHNPLPPPCWVHLSMMWGCAAHPATGRSFLVAVLLSGKAAGRPAMVWSTSASANTCTQAQTEQLSATAGICCVMMRALRTGGRRADGDADAVPAAGHAVGRDQRGCDRFYALV